MVVDIKELRSQVAKLNLAIEKSKLNPKSGWVEIIANPADGKFSISASNFDYYLETNINIGSGFEDLHATIMSETFIPLISKLDDDTADFTIRNNCLILSTSTSSYTFPLIMESGKVKSIDGIRFDESQATKFNLVGSELATIASANTKGLLDSVFTKDIQQYIYVDNLGAITFTENIYINNFKNPSDSRFKILLNATQAKLLDAFDGCDNVELFIIASEYTSAYRIKFKSSSVNVVMIVQSAENTDKFPSIRLRQIADAVQNTHVVVDKKLVDKALSRLMVFDKKFDITVMNYSKIVFEQDHIRFVSIKNNNYETVPYISAIGAIKHESIIRFADLIKQLKAIHSKDIDISYGNSPAIIINGDIKQMIPEIQLISKV